MCLGEHFRDEQRLATQSNIGADIFLYDVVIVAHTTQGQGNGELQFFSCKIYNHIARTCPQRVYNYCKQLEHITKKCPTRPQNWKAWPFEADVQDLLSYFH